MKPSSTHAPEWTDPDLIEWLTRDAAEWKARLKGTALARAKRAGLLRNAALVLGTRGSTEAIAPLAARLDDCSEDASVRASAAWALGRIGTASTSRSGRHRDDPEPLVRIQSSALGRHQASRWRTSRLERSTTARNAAF